MVTKAQRQAREEAERQQAETSQRALGRVRGLMDEWAALRSELREIEAAEHPDITDDKGRVWTWSKGDLYTTPMPHLGTDYVAAWPKHFIPTTEDTE